MANRRRTNLSFQSRKPNVPRPPSHFQGPVFGSVRRRGDRPAAGACERVDLLADGGVLPRTNRKERRRGSPGGELRGVIAGLRRGLRVGLQLVQRGGMDEAMAARADQQAGCDVGTATVTSRRRRRRGRIEIERRHRSVNDGRRGARRSERVRTGDHERHSSIQLPRLVHPDADDDEADDVLDAREERQGAGEEQQGADREQDVPSPAGRRPRSSAVRRRRRLQSRRAPAPGACVGRRLAVRRR